MNGCFIGCSEESKIVLEGSNHSNYLDDDNFICPCETLLAILNTECNVCPKFLESNFARVKLIGEKYPTPKQTPNEEDSWKKLEKSLILIPWHFMWCFFRIPVVTKLQVCHRAPVIRSNIYASWFIPVGVGELNRADILRLSCIRITTPSTMQTTWPLATATVTAGLDGWQAPARRSFGSSGLVLVSGGLRRS